VVPVLVLVGLIRNFKKTLPIIHLIIGIISCIYLGGQLLLECFNRFGQYMLGSTLVVGLKDPEEVKECLSA